jgi:hypothetical protein
MFSLQGPFRSILDRYDFRNAESDALLGYYKFRTGYNFNLHFEQKKSRALAKAHSDRKFTEQ